MENDIGIVGDAKLGERKAVDVQLSGPCLKGSVNISSNGSIRSDENKGYEKAIEAESPPVGPEDIKMSKGENVELVGTLDNNKGNSNVFDEAHKVEEVVGGPCAVTNTEDAGSKIDLMSEKNHGEEQIFTENIVRDERNGLVDDGIAEIGKGDGGEIAGPAVTAGDSENLSDENKKLSQSSQKPEHAISKNMNYLEAFTSGDANIVDAGTREEPIISMQDNLDPTESSRAEADSEKIDTERFEMTEIQDVNKIKEGDIDSNIPKNGTLDLVTLGGSLNHEDMSADSDSLKEQIHETWLEIEDAYAVKRSGANPRLESKSSGDTLQKNEQNAVLGSGHQQDKHENAWANLHSELQEDQSGEHGEKSGISGAVLKDDMNTRAKILDSECMQVEKVDNQDVNNEENSDIAAADTSVTACPKENSELDINLCPATVDSAQSLEIIAEVEPCSSSSESLTESSSSPQPQLVEANSDDFTTVVERPEQERVKDEEKEIHLSGTQVPEVRPIPGISSSSGNSPNPDLTPAHPTSLEHSSKVQEPVPLDISTNAELEFNPNANTSSAKSVSSHPTGHKQTALPAEPASQSKEWGSRSAADIPSANITLSTPARPTGLGHAAPLLEPTSRVVQHPRANGAVSAVDNQLIEDPTNGEAEGFDETHEKLQMIRVKFLCLAYRLGQTTHNVVVAQVLYRLGLAEQLHGGSGGRVASFSFDRASAMAKQLEASGQEPLDFTCTIMVLGKSGVGKSATINSIFDEAMLGTDACQLGTKKVQDIVGTVQGIRVRVIDTPGLLPSWSDQRQNEKILRSVKKFIKKTPPDIVLYLDRLDMQSTDFGDMPLLRTITEIFGPSIWFNAIVVLTHAASAPPEGPNGTATSYDMFVTQRSQVVQQAIRQAAGDMRLMNPVSLVENHSACRTNRAGQRVLPNGQVWKPHLLLLSFASKILAEANTLLNLQDTPPGRAFAPRTRSPPLPFLLSSLLQSRPEVKLPSEQFGDDDTIDDDLDECSDSEDSEYDELPPFKPLTKAQLDKLTKIQRKSYYDELEYREKLFMKKQLKEERKHRKMLKKMQEEAKDFPADYGDNAEEEPGGAASVPVPMPDLALPASFDSDNPTHRYRSLDSSNPWLVRAVLEPNGWDHDIGYDGINIERLFAVKNKVPISFSGQISKDKKDANLQMEIASSVKYGRGKATSLGFDMQSVGKDYAYTLRSETRFSNHRINKAAAGLSATVLGDVLTGGLKVEDKLIIGKRGQLVVSGGAIYGRGEVAYGGSLEATLRDKGHPFGRFLSTLGISVMDWHGDLAVGCNSQTQIPIGRHTNLIGRLNINNRGSGQFSVKVNSSEQLQIMVVGLIPLVNKILAIVNSCNMDDGES